MLVINTVQKHILNVYVEYDKASENNFMFHIYFCQFPPKFKKIHMVFFVFCFQETNAY